MNFPTCVTLVLLVTGLVGCSANSPDPAANATPAVSPDSAANTEPEKLEGDKLRLQGVWVATLAEVAGFDVADYRGSTIEFRGETAILTTKEKGADKVETHRFELDESTSPKRLTSYVVDDAKTEPQRAIYKLAGDELTLCYGSLSSDFPTVLSSKPLNMLIKLKRK